MRQLGPGNSAVAKGARSALRTIHMSQEPAQKRSRMASQDLKSFVDVPADNHFPIQNIPFGVGCPKEGGDVRCVSRIGDMVRARAPLRPHRVE